MSGGQHAPVVVTRKHKRLNLPLHLLAFVLTGGASAPVSASKAAATRRTTRARASCAAHRERRCDREFTDADHERALRAGREAMRRLSGQ